MTEAEPQLLSFPESQVVDIYLDGARKRHWTLQDVVEELNAHSSLGREIKELIVSKRARRKEIPLCFNDGELDFIRLVIKETYTHDFTISYVLDVINSRNMSCKITRAEVETMCRNLGYVMNMDFEMSK
jgi:hypothetical protein